MTFDNFVLTTFTTTTVSLLICYVVGYLCVQFGAWFGRNL